VLNKIYSNNDSFPQVNLMKNQKILLALALLASAVITGTAQASLFDRGNGLIYDDVKDITWTANANINGLMTWTQAVAWADNLVLGGYSDWRLPTTIPAIAGNNQTGSEMGELFYNELGGTAEKSIVLDHSNSANYDLFSNVQHYIYWSGSEYLHDATKAWNFGTDVGDQDKDAKGTLFYAWAVRPGDVSAVPVPGAVWLFGSGLLGLLGFKRRKAA
jgi:hypothetical protein